jgi:hypothetical protein
MPGAAAALALANAIAFTRPGLAEQPGPTAQPPPPTVIGEPARLRDGSAQEGANDMQIPAPFAPG